MVEELWGISQELMAAQACGCWCGDCTSCPCSWVPWGNDHEANIETKHVDNRQGHNAGGKVGVAYESIPYELIQ